MSRIKSKITVYIKQKQTSQINFKQCLYNQLLLTAKLMMQSQCKLQIWSAIKYQSKKLTVINRELNCSKNTT